MNDWCVRDDWRHGPMTSGTARTTIVSVCYNSTAVLPGMLASVPAGMPVVLVDNASSDSDALTRLARDAGAAVIRNDTNCGFGAACNQGAAVAATEFILFLNPDAALTPGAMAALEAAMDRHSHASAINPRILGHGGRPYFKRRSALLPRSAHLKRSWPETDCQVPVLSGAALMVRRQAFAAVDGFDTRIFLYHEDDDLSIRLAATCGPLMAVTDAVVQHLEGRSTERSAESAALKARAMGRSRVYAMRKHGRPLAFLRSFLLAVMQVLNPVTWPSHRSRAKAAAFLRGVIAEGRESLSRGK